MQMKETGTENIYLLIFRYLSLFTFVDLSHIAVVRTYVLWTLSVLPRLMELNLLILVMVHDRVIINCGLFIQYRARPDDRMFVSV
jgi:hypothetical protein